MTSLLSALRQHAPQISPEAFLAHHPGCFIQYYDDTPAKDPAKALSTRLFSPSFAARKQLDKCAVCFSLQAFKGSRTKERVTCFRNLGVDVDLVPAGDRKTVTASEIDQRKEDYLRRHLRPFSLKPHWLIETGHGFHVIFRLRPRTDAAGIADGEDLQRQLVRALQGDENACLLTQVLRVPGYQQFKDPVRPFHCRLLLDNVKTVEPFDPDIVRSVLTAWHVFHAEKTTSHQIQKAPPGPSGGEPKKWQAGLSGVAEGQRNDTAASLAGKILSELPSELWETAGWGGLKEWNQKNPAPLPENELRTVFASIVRRERAKREARELPGDSASVTDGRSQAQAEKLIALTRRGDLMLFHDQFGEPHAHVRIGTARRTCKVRGQEFREWLAQRLWETERKACGSDALHAALNTLAGIARYEGKRISLENRVAWHESSLWYDLGDAQGRAVRVTAELWEVVGEPPALFRRYSHQLPQTCPVRGRPLSALLPFINLANARQQSLLLVYLVSCFLPDIPHPIGVFFGPQGAAKSTATRLLRRLVDPTALEGLSLADPRQLPQVLFHHWFAAFDNVSGISEELSDLLCRAVTGDGFSRRRLYSDDEDLIYHFRRCLCLNGITLVAERPDLLDRCLLFPLDHISEADRYEERELVRRFDELRPELLGAIFDALSGALRSYASLPALPLPRMADFARWGCAVADALGLGRDAFLSLYGENVHEQREAAIEASPVAFAVTELMVRRQEWSGTASELLAQLQKLLRSGGSELAGLPRRPNLLTRQLNVMTTTLAHAGIVIDTGHRTPNRRRIMIRRRAAAVSPPYTSIGARVGRGSRVPLSSVDLTPPTPPAVATGGGRDDDDDGDGGSADRRRKANPSESSSLAPSPSKP